MERDSFPSVKIGSLVWAKENLQVSKFRNGEPIPLVKDDEEWSELKSAAYCIGPGGHYFYNWFAVKDPRGLTPEGWHVPTDEEWEHLWHYLAQKLGDEGLVGEALKDDKAWDGTNSSGFCGLPAGYRDGDGYFGDLGFDGYWWSSSPVGSYALNRYLYSGYSFVYRYDYNPRSGFSVRCVRD
jgi:uncharacterized protein (TIGR02145 family)